jgi:hypothetical protein
MFVAEGQMGQFKDATEIPLKLFQKGFYTIELLLKL